MIEIEAIDHVVLRTSQLREMLAFYIQVLGCSLEKAQPDIGLHQLRAGAGLIDLLDSASAPAGEPRRLDHFCLRLTHFDSADLCRHLQQHGVEAGEVHTRYGARGSGPSMYVHDPDGNTVELKAPPE